MYIYYLMISEVNALIPLMNNISILDHVNLLEEGMRRLKHGQKQQSPQTLLHGIAYLILREIFNQSPPKVDRSFSPYYLTHITIVVCMSH